MREEKNNEILKRLTNAIEELKQASILLYEDFMEDICEVDINSAHSDYENINNMIYDILDFINERRK